MPALHEATAQAGIRQPEMKHQIEPAGALESAIDEIEGTVGREDKDHAFIDADAVERGQEDRLVITGMKDTTGTPIMRKVWLAQWSPVEEVGKGAGHRYGKPVKVKKLPDGTARVTEQDGDQWIVGLDGTASPADKKLKPRLGVDPKLAQVSRIYEADDGEEHAYYGRGHAQLTWWSNYARVGAQTGRGLSLLFDPAKALDPRTSYEVLSFSLRTGKGFANNHKLSDYFNETRTDYVAARAMVNGRDHAEDIARYAQKFEAILLKIKK
jgi:hypothetical protein